MHDESARGVEYTPKDHIFRISELMRPERVRILSKDHLEAVLRDAEWSGMYDDSRDEEDDDVDCFDANRHFVVVDRLSPLRHIQIPGATVVAPLFNLCILYWSE